MRKFDLLALTSTFIFISSAIIVSLNRYWQYEVFYIDFGIFDQAIWEVSRFRPPIIDHFLVGGKWIFADHFNPSIFLLSPFYWLTDRSEMLLIVQAISVGLSGLVIYAIGKTITKHQLFSFSILGCYFLFIGLQNAVITEFHEITVMTLPLSLVFYAIVKKNVWLYFVFLVITLGFKEATFALGTGVGLFVFLLRREWRRIGVVTILISIAWGIVGIFVIVPHFSNGLYVYSPTFPEGVFGKIAAFIDHPLKRSTLFYSLLSFGFLPLVSPYTWFLIVQDYALRFLPQGCCTRWDLGLHYNAQSAVILAVSTFFAFAHLKKFRMFLLLSNFIAILLLINAVVLYRFILRGPLALSYNPAFYTHTNDFQYLNNLVNKIPKSATVMTQNNIAARFTHQKVFLLRQNYKDFKPDYILIDNRPGQNPNNFFTTKNVQSIIDGLKKDTDYLLWVETKEQFIFKRL